VAGLYLFVRAHGETYTLPCERILEVVPIVPLRTIAGAPPFIEGMLTYRGSVVVVINLTRLLCDRDSVLLLSSRIVVLRSSSATEPPRGLLIEKVDEVRQLDTVRSAAGRTVSRFVSGTLLERGRVVQLLDVDQLLETGLYEPGGSDEENDAAAS
jgi:chemotaxis-related protein WspB